MRLFHFTCDHQVKGVERDGMTLGKVILDINPVRMAQGYQWCTVNPDPNQQTWITPKGMPTLLRCDRTENRFTIEVPSEHDSSVLTLEQLFLLEPMNILALEATKSVGKHEDWRIFKGTIPVSWITSKWSKP